MILIKSISTFAYHSIFIIMKEQARISGIAYIMIFLTGFYANFIVLETLLIDNDISLTITNLVKNHSQFQGGIIGFFLMVIFDLVLVWSLFGLTKPVNKNLSYLASSFRFFHGLFFAIALYKLQTVYLLTEGFPNNLDIQDHVELLIMSFDELWTIGLLFFGVHLFVLGFLILKSTYIPNAIGALLILAALGYIVEGSAKLFLPNYYDYKETLNTIVILPAVVGELSLAFWLMFKGFSIKSF